MTAQFVVLKESHVSRRKIARKQNCADRWMEFFACRRFNAQRQSSSVDPMSLTLRNRNEQGSKAQHEKNDPDDEKSSHPMILPQHRE